MPESLTLTSDAIWRESIALRERVRSNSRSQKRRRSRRNIHVAAAASPRPAPEVFWRKCMTFAKTRFAGPGPNSSSRRRPRGAKGRFGPLVDRSCRMQRAAEAGGDPGAAWSYSELRRGRAAGKYHTGARITLRCPWILAGGTPYLRPVVLGPLRRSLRPVSIIARLGPRTFEKTLR